LLVSRINMSLLTNATLGCSPTYALQGTKIRSKLRPLFNHPLSSFRKPIILLNLITNSLNTEREFQVFWSLQLVF